MSQQEQNVLEITITPCRIICGILTCCLLITGGIVGIILSIPFLANTTNTNDTMTNLTTSNTTTNFTTSNTTTLSSSSSSSSSSSLCPANNGSLSGWYFYDDRVCFYNDGRRRLFVGSLYRSFSETSVDEATLTTFNGAYWAIDSGVTHNVLPLLSLNTSCTSTSLDVSCANYFWERVRGGKVINITNPAGVSLTTFIQNRIEGSELWEDLTMNDDLSQYPDFCTRAINTEEAKGYIAKFPNVLTDLDSVSENVYDSSIESHLMLCNLIEYPYFPQETPRGSVDGSRLHNIFTVAFVNNTVYYTYLCPSGEGRLLSAHSYQPVYLVMLTQLYKKYIFDVDYDVTFDYTPKNFTSYPDIMAIPCVPINENIDEFSSG